MPRSGGEGRRLTCRAERDHLRCLSKISGGECTAHTRAEPPRRDVRPPVLRTLDLLEPGIAVVTNRLGDVLARTSGFESVTRELVRETLELPEDAQQLVVFLPADEATAQSVDGRACRSAGRLRAV